MPVTAIGPVSTPLEILKTICVQSQAFIDRCAIDSLTPSSQVFIHALRPAKAGDVVLQADITRPFVLIKMKDFEFNEFDTCEMQPKGTIGLHINDKNRQDNFQDGIVDFANFYGSLVEEISEQTYVDNGLVNRTINQANEVQAVARHEAQDDFNFFTVEFDIRVGADF